MALNMSGYGLKSTGRILAWALLLSAPVRLVAADKVTSDKVGRGISSSLALDRVGNQHLVYLGLDAKVYYAFKPASSQKWFTIPVLESTHSTQNIYPRVATDKDGRPHVCVATGELQYISFRDGKWTTQVIDPGSGTLSYHCSIAIAADGTPHMSWYHEFLPGGKQFTHLRHADIEDGVWVVRSVDGGISGKWNSMVLDSKGFPHLSYSQFANGGDLQYAEWDGKAWNINDVDSSHNSSTARGYDNSLALGTDGLGHISYFDGTKLKYAYQKDGKWILETVTTVDSGYDNYTGSTTMLLDERQKPHIVFGDFGAIKHSFRRGDKWETETVVAGAVQQYSNVDAAIGPGNSLYVSYPDPQDGFVKVSVVKLSETAEETKTDEKASQPEPK
jgi:hypothetical protein